jgi:lipoate-protein ligase A
MNGVDITLDCAADNLALDEALLLEAETHPPREWLRFWELPTYAVVLGSAGKISEDVHISNCEFDGVPIYRRSSGGGTVLLGPGSLCFSLVLCYDRHPALGEISSSYRFILDTLLAALNLPDTALQGICDLTWAGQKFSGNAQQRKRFHLLHHGTLLYDFDLPRVGRYLTLPPRRPDYRADRPHETFVRNLPLTRSELVSRLAEVWGASWVSHPLLPLDAVADLVASKYALDSWNRRR